MRCGSGPAPPILAMLATGLSPILLAPLAIQLHTGAAISALLLGIVQLAAPKGTIPHRAFGYVWVGLMATVALTSFAIHEIRLLGPFSPIHLLSLYVLVMLPVAVLSARRRRVSAHRRYMIRMFTFGLVLTGVFTLLPGRVLGRLLFGG